MQQPAGGKKSGESKPQSEQAATIGMMGEVCCSTQGACRQSYMSPNISISFLSRMSALAIPAVRQILARLAKGDKEEEEFVEKIENSCLKFDHDKKGMLTPDEYFNVMKLQNGVECTKEEVISRSFIVITIST